MISKKKEYVQARIVAIIEEANALIKLCGKVIFLYNELTSTSTHLHWIERVGKLENIHLELSTILHGLTKIRRMNATKSIAEKVPSTPDDESTIIDLSSMMKQIDHHRYKLNITLSVIESLLEDTEGNPYDLVSAAYIDSDILTVSESVKISMETLSKTPIAN